MMRVLPCQRALISLQDNSPLGVPPGPYPDEAVDRRIGPGPSTSECTKVYRQ